MICLKRASKCKRVKVQDYRKSCPNMTDYSELYALSNLDLTSKLNTPVVKVDYFIRIFFKISHL